MAYRYQRPDLSKKSSEMERKERWFNFVFYGAFLFSIAFLVLIIYVVVHFLQKYW